jgi:hypothetical protein
MSGIFGPDSLGTAARPRVRRRVPGRGAAGVGIVPFIPLLGLGAGPSAVPYDAVFWGTNPLCHSGWFYRALYEWDGTAWKTAKTNGPYNACFEQFWMQEGWPDEPEMMQTGAKPYPYQKLNPPYLYVHYWYWTTNQRWQPFVDSASWDRDVPAGEWRALAGLGGIGQDLTSQQIDCAALCAPLMLSFGAPAVAMCAARCQDMTATKTCFVPSVCVDVASKYPELMSPELVKAYCSLPAETQQGVEIQCNAISAQTTPRTGTTTTTTPTSTPPPLQPKAEPEPEKKAGIGVGTIALIGVAGLGAYMLFRKKGRK